ncbi:unnamed protein product [Gemmataceae bacterium]|nr:unnamed protein product [Gemmataceae bacterium]VTU00885.1 unnamed protein product [Gemmataceae bacterium]
MTPVAARISGPRHRARPGPTRTAQWNRSAPLGTSPVRAAGGGPHRVLFFSPRSQQWPGRHGPWKFPWGERPVPVRLHRPLAGRGGRCGRSGRTEAIDFLTAIEPSRWSTRWPHGGRDHHSRGEHEERERDATTDAAARGRDHQARRRPTGWRSPGVVAEGSARLSGRRSRRRSRPPSRKPWPRFLRSVTATGRSPLRSRRPRCRRPRNRRSSARGRRCPTTRWRSPAGSWPARSAPRTRTPTHPHHTGWLTTVDAFLTTLTPEHQAWETEAGIAAEATCMDAGWLAALDVVMRRG